MAKPRDEKAVNLLVIGADMSPLETLTHQIDAGLEQSACVRNTCAAD